MEIKMFQIDAFTDNVFAGNPAAVCPLDKWLPDEIMQRIAMENNLSETAFFVKEGEDYRIRWFTPVDEVDLCGHATLASAFALFTLLNYKKEKIVFHSRSGPLYISREDDWLTMDFPAQPPQRCDPPSQLLSAFSIKPREVLKSEDYFVVFDNEDEILRLRPNMEKLKQLDLRGIIVTAPGKEVDFVSRFFAPALGVDEDPVTGSAHCELTPYWAQKLNKNKFKARQLSLRGGFIRTELRGDRVLILGKAVKYLEGKITI